MPQEQHWQEGDRSPQLPGLPHEGQDTPTAPRTHGNTCNTEPMSGPKASHPEKHLPIPTLSGRQQCCVMFPAVCFIFLQEKVAFGPRAEVFGHLPPLSAPSLKFSRIFSKVFERLQVPQVSHFSALKDSGLVAENKYVKR